MFDSSNVFVFRYFSFLFLFLQTVLGLFFFLSDFIEGFTFSHFLANSKEKLNPEDQPFSLYFWIKQRQCNHVCSFFLLLIYFFLDFCRALQKLGRVLFAVPYKTPEEYEKGLGAGKGARKEAGNVAGEIDSFRRQREWCILAVSDCTVGKQGILRRSTPGKWLKNNW